MILRSRSLSFSRGGRRLIDDVSLDAATGELVALVGPNGAGKSTLLRLLSGECRPDSGTIELASRPLASLRQEELGRLRAVMPQETLLSFAFTVREVVTMGRHPHRRRTDLGPHADQAAIAAALAATDTEGLAERTFPTLSGGEKGRTTFARVLAQEPCLLLLDEPTAALDIRHQQQLMQTARALADHGATVIAAVHDLNLAARYAHRVAILHEGRLVADGPPRGVFSAALLTRVFEYPLDVMTAPHSTTPLIVPSEHY